MPDAKPVRVPQETVNDERVRLVRWRVEEGAPVEPGAVLAEIETSKSVLEVTAGEGGFLRRAASEGDWVPVGGVFCYLTVHADDPVPMIAQGLWPGRILDAPQGTNGFGYDPLFWVDDYACSAAELDAGVKNRISHRGQAVTQLLQLLHG